MIFDTIKFGIFTADDFFTAHNTNNFTKFTALPIDLRKKFISDVIDKVPNQESNNFKEVAFDFLDGKITEDQFREAYWNYWTVAVMMAAVIAAVVIAAAAGAAAVAVAVSAVVVIAAVTWGKFRPYFEQHASLLNKLIQEYQS